MLGKYSARITAKVIVTGGILLLSVLLIYAYAEGDIEDLKDFRYWDNGKVKDCTVYDSQGRLKAKAFCRHDGTVEKVEKYDIYGNKAEEALYDQNGRLKTGIDGWAAARWWYDGRNLISQISYDEYGKPIERKQYSDSGKLVFRQYRDDIKTEPYEEASMALLLGSQNVKYYDSGGRLDDFANIVRE